MFHLAGLDIAGLDRESQPQSVTPTGNSKVIDHLERLVEDHRWTIVDWHIPPTYGELRWLVARILACEYAYQGIKTLIILEDMIRPAKLREITIIKKRLKISHVDKVIEHRLLPTTTEIIRPQDYCKWCSQEAVEKRRCE